MPSRTSTDEPMADAESPSSTVPVGSIHMPRYPTNDPRIKVLPPYSDHRASFEFLHEDHTIGNALRYIIMKNPEVEFCGYSIPHPAEPKMNLRIQTYEGTTVWDALAKGLDDLVDLCNVVEEKFVAAREEFAQKMET